MKREGSVMEKRTTLKRTVTANSDISGQYASPLKHAVSRSMLDESMQGKGHQVSFTEDKIGGAGRILTGQSINLDESVNFQRDMLGSIDEEKTGGMSAGRRPKQDEIDFFNTLKSDVEGRANIKFSEFELTLICSQEIGGSLRYHGKVRIGRKYVHVNVIRHSPNTFGGKKPEILKVEINKYENDPL